MNTEAAFQLYEKECGVGAPICTVFCAGTDGEDIHLVAFDTEIVIHEQQARFFRHALNELLDRAKQEAAA